MARKKKVLSPRFRVPLGQIVLTRAINNKVADNTKFSKFVLNSLRCHASGHWGDVCEEDKKANDWSYENGERILSSYSDDSSKIWIITERDRSATTILFPEEY